MKKILGVLIGLCAFAAHAQVIVVANPKIDINEIQRAEIYHVFTGGSSALNNGTKVIPTIQSDGKVQDDFLKNYVHKANAAFLATWRSFVFAGQATLPKTLESDQAVVEYVATHPYSIGYIDKSSPHEAVKVLSVK